MIISYLCLLIINIIILRRYIGITTPTKWTHSITKINRYNKRSQGHSKCQVSSYLMRYINWQSRQLTWKHNTQNKLCHHRKSWWALHQTKVRVRESLSHLKTAWAARSSRFQYRMNVCSIQKLICCFKSKKYDLASVCPRIERWNYWRAKISP